MKIGDLLKIKPMGSCVRSRRTDAMKFIGPVILIIGFPPDGDVVRILAGDRTQNVHGSYLRDLYEELSCSTALI